MLSLKFVRENMAVLLAALRDRGTKVDLSGFTECEEERRRLLAQAESLRQERNRVSTEIALLKKKGEEGKDLIAAMRQVGARVKEIEDRIRECEERLEEMLLFIPNLPHASVPRGRCADDNPEIKRWGERRQFTFPPRPHWEIGESLGIIDFERAAKIAGARFALLVGAGARLERALINFMLDIHTREHGYTEVLPPFLVNRSSMRGTGQLPKFEQELFRLTDDDLMLIPTAEVPVTNIHRDEILPGEALSLKYVAYTPCFRREAGAYGKDTRGLIRQHQFNKVELVRFARPEDSYRELERLLADAERILVLLGIPYRVVTLCTGDLGFAAAKTYDIEAWMPSQEAFREVSSCSNFEDFQARRANIRFRRDAKAKPELVHTLNGSGLAVGRTMVALLENYQEEDGSVTVPPVLVPYLDGVSRLGPPVS